MGNRTGILFVCTGNAGRSQMAEALCRQLAGDSVVVESAGVEPWDHLHPMAVKLMAERGLNLSDHYPKGVRAVRDRAFDLVVTIGEPARMKTPLDLPGDPNRIHWDISDPADADGTDDCERVFRRAAEAIEQRLPKLLQTAKAIT